MKTKHVLIILFSFIFIFTCSVAEAATVIRPSLTVKALSSSQIQMNWVTNMTNASGTKVERSLSATTGFRLIATIGAPVTMYIDTGLKPATAYYYRIRAYKRTSFQTIYSPYSTTVKATTLVIDTTPPSVPTGLSATAASSSEIDLNWQPSTDSGWGVGGYKIYCNSIYLGTVTESIYHDSGLAENTRYCYTISSYDNAGNTSAQSEQVCMTTPASVNSDIESSPFGFHSALVVEQGYNKNGYYDAQNIGVKWNRPSLYAYWFIIQPDIDDPTYNWEQYDRLYGNVPSDMRILANIAPQGMTDKGYALANSYIPIDEEKYVAFVKATVERYDGDGIDDMPGLQNPVKYWQVYNEPQVLIINDFADLQRITYLAIKEACPDCKVLIGGVGGFPDDFENNLFAYNRMLSDLHGQYVDIFDFHWYGFADGDYRKSKDAYNLVISRLTAQGFGNIPVWITEMGSHSGTITADPYGKGITQTEAQQAGDYLKRFIYPLSFGVKKIFSAFGLIEGFKNDGGYFDFTGLIYDGVSGDDRGLGVKKLGYYTYKLMTDKLQGSDWGNVITVQESDNVYIFKFTKGNNSVYIAWWDYFDEVGYSKGDTKTVTLTVDFTGEASIIHAVPGADSGADLNENDYPNFFATEKRSISNKQVTFNLDESPVFVEVSK